jgi:hypothetical protein
MNRRGYLTGGVSVATLALAGCTGLGSKVYEVDASEHILSHRDIARVLSENFAADSISLDEEEGVDTGELYDVWEGSLSLYGLVICESIEDGESWYQRIKSDAEEIGVGNEDISLGDEAIYNASQGFRLVAVRLSNVVIQINGRSDFSEMEDLAELQIERIKESS